VIVAMLVRLAPLLDFSLWGSDWGEYYSVAQGVVDQGAHPEENLGWGRAYVDFPGVFDLAGSVSILTGLSVAHALLFIIPSVTALSCLLIACLVLRLGGGPWAALFAAAFLAVAFPEVFTNSHPVPGPMGSVLVLAVMLVFLMGDIWRWETDGDARRPLCLYLLMLVVAMALAATHHMSLYFAIGAVLVSHMVRSALVKGREPEREWWGVWTVMTLLTMATVFWLVLAPTFREEVMVDLFGGPGVYVVAMAWLVITALLLVARSLSRMPRGTTPVLSILSNPPYSGSRDLRIFFVAFIGTGLAIMIAVAVFGFPGTTIEPNADFMIYSIPVMLVFAMAIGSTDVVLRKRGGHVILGWVTAIVVSFLISIALQSQVLLSYRHLPYVVEASAIFIGFGAVHLRTRAIPEGRMWTRGFGTAVALLFVVLLVTSYPPKEVMGGFQEGTNQDELESALWLRGGLPAPGAAPDGYEVGTVATDHRLSSLAFGLGGQMATWDRGGSVLHSTEPEKTVKHLRGVGTPEGKRPVTVVLLSEDLRDGAALFQWEGADPVGDAAWNKFFEPPFVRLYDGGEVWVLGIERPLEGELYPES
jgi:hypothetical protein